jgi:3-methyladenine DNA glycosylase AlkD
LTALLDTIVAAFERARDPVAAEPMARYMRNQFPFLGIGTPARRALLRATLTAPDARRIDRVQLLALVGSLWDKPEREYQYAACDLLVRGVKVLTTADLPAIETCIISKSWWDTVDALATSVVGPIVLADRESGDRTIDRWIASDDVWLARAAILHQNKWKAATDEPRLFSLCLARSSDSEFFLRKAIGWALREYSRTAPEAVRSFVAEHDEQLSGLSKREGLKRLARGR